MVGTARRLEGAGRFRRDPRGFVPDGRGRLGAITYELGAVLVLSALYLAVGVALFQRMHLRRA